MGKSKRILNSLTFSSTICKFEKIKKCHTKKHPQKKKYKITEIKNPKKNKKKYPKTLENVEKKIKIRYNKIFLF